MFIRFKKIIQTGVFHKTDDIAKYEFKNTVVFYGENTQGKTTFKDIFNSLALDDPSQITVRKSIPAMDRTLQEVVLCYKKNTCEEMEYKFANDKWSSSDLKGRVLVFDNDFIHRNLITGFEITRANKESYTDFILGEGGVSISENIRVLNEQLTVLKSKIIIPGSLNKNSTADEINQFINMQVNESLEELKESIKLKENELSHLNNQAKISALPETSVPVFDLEEKIKDVVEKMNLEFIKNYKDVTKETLNFITDHFDKCITNKEPHQWVKTGLLLKKNDHCPFCGQNISELASKLIDMYHSYFNNNYESYTKDISSKLSSVEAMIDKLNVSATRSFIEAELHFNKYKEYNPTLEFVSDIVQLKISEDELNSNLEEWKIYVKNAIIQKNKEPHVASSDITLSEKLSLSLSAFLDMFKAQCLILDNLISKANKFKEDITKLTPDEVKTKVATVGKDIEILKRKKDRIDHNRDCEIRIAQQEEIKTLENRIATEKINLETEQSEYICKYYDELNKQYSSLGSGEFELKSSTHNRGNKKVYEFNISYKDIDIPNGQIHKLLSESDKRSLAFSIFLTKLQSLAEKDKYIVVLDDPVVSFDDHRIRITVDIIKSLVDDFKQIIVFTHYPYFIKRLLNYKVNAAYFELSKNNITCTYNNLKVDKFTKSDQELAFDKIYRFIKQEHDEDISQDLRVYLENYLKIIFQNNILENNISVSSLHSLIIGLYNHQLISKDIHDKLNSYRESLNHEHHAFSGKNIQDTRIYANNLLNTLRRINGQNI